MDQAKVWATHFDEMARLRAENRQLKRWIVVLLVGGTLQWLLCLLG